MTITICIGCYASYNAGYLVDEWVDLPMPDAELDASLARIRSHAQRLTGDLCEELYVSDYDGRVADRMRERLEGLDGPDYVFAAPHGGLCDENNARKALCGFYDELAEKLGIPALSQERRVTHMWRTSLNDEWRNAGVPREWRVAYLGHTEEVNERSYTKDVRFDHFIDMLGA